MLNIPQGYSEPQQLVLCMRPRLLAGLVKVEAVSDTVVALLPSRHLDFEWELEQSGAHVLPRPRPDRGGNVWWWPVHVNRKTRRTLAVIEKWKPALGLKINRHDIALDLTFETPWQMQRAMERLGAGLALKRQSRHAQRYWVENTLYLHDTRDKSKPARTLVLYQRQQHSKVLRIELRFQSTDAVRRNGLGNLTPDGFAGINPRALFNRHVALNVLAPEYIAELQGEALARHDRTAQLFGFASRWRAMLPQRVESNCLRSAGLDTWHGMPSVASNELHAVVPSWLDALPA